MSLTITVSPETYELLERRAKKEGRSIDQLAEILLQGQLEPRTREADMDELLCQALGLSKEELADLIANLPPVAKLREEISKCIPPEVKLSDEIIAMREE